MSKLLTVVPVHVCVQKAGFAKELLAPDGFVAIEVLVHMWYWMATNEMRSQDDRRLQPTSWLEFTNWHTNYMLQEAAHAFGSREEIILMVQVFIKHRTHEFSIRNQRVRERADACELHSQSPEYMRWRAAKNKSEATTMLRKTSFIHMKDSVEEEIADHDADHSHEDENLPASLSH